MLSETQISEIKKQLISQIEKNFPIDKKEFAISQIKDMEGDELEEFLKQNNLSIQQGESDNRQKCIFCSIILEQIPSYKIDEISEAIAVLEINPLSKGHTIIIPKEHISSKEKISKLIKNFANKIAKNIKTILKPQNVKISDANLFGHQIINLIPIYEDTNLNAERKPSSEDELTKLQKQLTIKSKTKKVNKQPKIKKIKPEEKIHLPIRIP